MPELEFCCGENASDARNGLRWAADVGATDVTLAESMQRAAQHAALPHTASEEAAAVAAKI
jgi:hypothetical protein